MSGFHRLAAVAGTLSIVALAVGVALAAASPAAQERMTFSMTAQYVGTANVGPESVGGQTPLTIGVEKFNTPDERDALEEIIINDGMQALADALRSAERVGFIRAPSAGTTGWQLRYAMMYAGPNNTRILRLATDRPISFAEAVERPRRTWDYNVSLIELVIDEEGRGEGVIYVGVEFAYDQTNDTLGIKSITSQPIRLSNVRLQQ